MSDPLPNETISVTGMLDKKSANWRNRLNGYEYVWVKLQCYCPLDLLKQLDGRFKNKDEFHALLNNILPPVFYSKDGTPLENSAWGFDYALGSDTSKSRLDILLESTINNTQHIVITRNVIIPSQQLDHLMIEAFPVSPSSLQPIIFEGSCVVTGLLSDKAKKTIEDVIAKSCDPLTKPGAFTGSYYSIDLQSQKAFLQKDREAINFIARLSMEDYSKEHLLVHIQPNALLTKNPHFKTQLPVIVDDLYFSSSSSDPEKGAWVVMHSKKFQTKQFIVPAIKAEDMVKKYPHQFKVLDVITPAFPSKESYDWSITSPVHIKILDDSASKTSQNCITVELPYDKTFQFKDLMKQLNPETFVVWQRPDQLCNILISEELNGPNIIASRWMSIDHSQDYEKCVVNLDRFQSLSLSELLEHNVTNISSPSHNVVRAWIQTTDSQGQITSSVRVLFKATKAT